METTPGVAQCLRRLGRAGYAVREAVGRVRAGVLSDLSRLSRLSSLSRLAVRRFPGFAGSVRIFLCEEQRLYRSGTFYHIQVAPAGKF